MLRLALALLFVAACSHQPTVSNSLPTLDAELTGFNYPFPVATLNLQLQQQDLKMAYMHVKSPTPNGRTVLLLHGKNFAGYYWEAVAKHLMKAGFDVVIPDQIGFGKSSKPAHFQYTFQALAKNTLALLDHLKIDRVSVVGHSMGGMLATRFSLMYPARTEKLVLMNPIGLEDWKLIVPYHGVEASYQGELKQTQDTIREYQRMSYYDGVWKPEYEIMIQAAGAQTRHKDYPRVAWNAALTHDMIFTQPVLYEFSKITTPTLLIIGTRDRTALGKPLVSEDVRKNMGRYEILGKKTQASIPGSKLVELPGVGHMPQVEALDQTVKALSEFLN